jgi:hypothetical protein
MERKYRQRGYMDKEWEDGKKPRRKEPPRDRLPDAPRGHRHAVSREAKTVLRCAACGHQTSPMMSIGRLERCSGCGAALHSCRNCAHFDTGARFQCRKPIPAPVTDKTAANDCKSFGPRQVLDSTGRRADTKPRDARAAFDALFRKK